MEQSEIHWRFVLKNNGIAEGNIIAIIIVSHIKRNIAAEIVQDCPGIRIHIMDIVQPPDISMPPDMARQK